MALCPSGGAVPYILKTTALIQQLRGLVSSFDVNHKYVQQWRNTLFAWQVAIYLSYRCSVCVCHQVVFTQWPTHSICNCMYYWFGQAVSWAFSSWPRSFVDFTASSSSSHKTVFVDSEVNKGSLKLNTSSSKRKTVKILREGSDLSREGWLKSTRRHHTSTYFWVKRLFGLFKPDGCHIFLHFFCCCFFFSFFLLSDDYVKIRHGFLHWQIYYEIQLM